MRKIITFTVLALTLMGGVALADRDGRWNRGGRDRDSRWDRRGGGVVVRDSHRDRRAAPGWHYERQRQHRSHRVHRRPVYINNGYYQFHNGHRYAYTRPVIRHRYFDYRVRPQIVFENYQPVAGYIWVAGQWQWNGYEWHWVSGHYAVDPSYAEPTWDEQPGSYYPQY